MTVPDPSHDEFWTWDGEKGDAQTHSVAETTTSLDLLDTFPITDQDAPRPKLLSRARIVKAADLRVWTRARQILDAARAELLASKQAASEAYDDACKRGYADGYSDGADAVAAQAALAARTIQEHYRTLEENLPSLVMDIVERIVEGFDDTQLIASAVRRAVKEQRGAEHFRLWASPQAVEEIEALLAKSDADVAGLVDVEPDPGLEINKALLWSTFGSVELSVPKQLEQFRTALSQEIRSEHSISHSL